MHCIRLRCGKFPATGSLEFCFSLHEPWGLFQYKNPEKKPSERGRDQLQQLYSQEFHVFLKINTRLYPGPVITSFNPNTFPCIFSRLSNVTFLVVLGELPVKKNKIQVGVLRDILMNYVLRNLVNIIFVYQMTINTTKVPRCQLHKIKTHRTWINDIKQFYNEHIFQVVTLNWGILQWTRAFFLIPLS